MDFSPLSSVAGIPYFTLPAIPVPLIGIDLQPFGILVATGVLFGAWICRKRTEYLMLDEDKVRSMIGWLLVCGFIGAHLFDTLFYQWDKLSEEPWLVFKIWEGISSYGGFIGGLVGFFIFLRVQHIEDKMGYADIGTWGLLPGFTFGRMGCTIVHDHPGKPSDFFLAIDYPASRGGLQGLRHDLGLYELIFLLFLAAVLVLVVRGWHRRTGFALGFIAIAYGVVRFFLDYLRLRDHDPRYFGLTFAQYVSVATLLAGIVVMWHVYRRTPPAPAAQPPDVASTSKAAAKTGASSAARKKKNKGKKRRR